MSPAKTSLKSRITVLFFLLVASLPDLVQHRDEPVGILLGTDAFGVHVGQLKEGGSIGVSLFLLIQSFKYALQSNMPCAHVMGPA